MHDIVTGFFKPNKIDDLQGIKGNFGSTINVINGGYECGWNAENREGAEDRENYFLHYLSEFGFSLTYKDADVIDDSSCETEEPFITGSAGDIKIYWKKGDEKGKCVLINKGTQYMLFAPDDYKRCVCDSWGRGEIDCAQED